jgi:hypothetical protein
MRDAPEGDIAAMVNDAEIAGDPLDQMLVRAAADPGAPFTADSLRLLATLQREDLARFEKFRVRLKNAGVRVSVLDEAINGERGSSGARKPTQADVLIKLASSADLFHTPDGVGFADININGHRETWQINSKGFRRWLARLFFEKTQGAASSEAVQSALNALEAIAQFDAPEREVFIRTGAADNRLYLNLADDRWRAVEIDAEGWRVVDTPPVRFRRSNGMQPLPVPVADGGIDLLRPFVNVASDTDFVLVVCWLVATLRDHGPYPLLVLSGEQGAAKSTFSRMLRAQET